MRNRIWMAAALTLAMTGSAVAQNPPTLPALTDPVDVARSQTTGKVYGSIDFGGRITQVDGDEARFQRYRDLRGSIYGTNMLLGRRTDDWNFEVQGWNAGYRDQRYLLNFQRVGRLTASFLWDQIPMFISRDTRTLYTQTAPGVFRIEDAIQQEIQAGARNLRNFESQAVRFDMKTERQIGQADVKFAFDRSTDITLLVRNTTRDGAIPFGATFGFNNAVELPVPVDWRHTELQSALEWGNDTGMLRIGWDGSTFDNNVESVTWDNPLRFGPDAAGQPSQGRMSLWPGNTLTYLHGTGAVSLPARTRLTAYVALGQGRSNEELLPFTINTAIAPIALARSTALAENQMTIAQFTLASRPSRVVSVNAKYRYSNVDVQTPVFDRPLGDVAYDTTFRPAAAASSEYHSVKRATVDADAAFQLVPTTSLRVGYSHLASDYTYRIWEQTAEDVFRVSLDTTGNQYFMFRGVYENRTREGEQFDAHVLAEVGELADMRHYDVANRDRQRFTLIANVMPGGIFGLTASAGVGRDEYRDSGAGLQSFDSDQYSAGFSVSPDDRYNLTASYGWERYESLQLSRGANNAADQANPLRNWTTNYTGKVNFLEAGFDIDAIERTAVRLSADWNRSNDTYLYGLVTGSPLVAPEQLPPVKNELLRGEIDVTYELTRNLRFGVAYWYDDYDVQDFALGPTTLSGLALPAVQEGQPVVATNALLLGYLYRPYTAHAGFVKFTYLW